MNIHQLVKDTIKQYKTSIELTQWAIINGISSLFYSEYIKCFKRKEVPVQSIMVPTIKNVKDYLDPESKFMIFLYDNLIDKIANHKLIQKYIDIPELNMFNEDNIEVMKLIYDLYISNNITRRIPETISKKFGLQDDSQQMFKESWDIRLFNDMEISDDQYKFIIDQIVLQLIMLIPSIEKEVEIPESNFKIDMCSDEILTINNDNAICPIHITHSIIENKSVMPLLSFVTNTNIDDLRNAEDYDCACKSDYRIINFIIRTGISNEVTLTRLKDIKV